MTLNEVQEILIQVLGADKHIRVNQADHLLELEYLTDPNVWEAEQLLEDELPLIIESLGASYDEINDQTVLSFSVPGDTDDDPAITVALFQQGRHDEP